MCEHKAKAHVSKRKRSPARHANANQFHASGHVRAQGKSTCLQKEKIACSTCKCKSIPCKWSCASTRQKHMSPKGKDRLLDMQMQINSMQVDMCEHKAKAHVSKRKRSPARHANANQFHASGYV